MDAARRTAIRDYVHVVDLATAHVEALKVLLDEHPGATLNLGTGSGYSVREILAAIKMETGHEVPHLAAARRSNFRVADPSAAREVLKFVPVYSDLSTIIQTAWAWHQKAHPRRRAGAPMYSGSRTTFQRTGTAPLTRAK
jgi:UDP-glucose 4-epimerase